MHEKSFIVSVGISGGLRVQRYHIQRSDRQALRCYRFLKLKKSGRRTGQRIGNADQHKQTWVSGSSFDATEIGQVDFGVVSELLLRKTALKAKPPDIPADHRSPIHLQDRPSSGLYATGTISPICKCLGGHVTFELTPDSEKPPAPKPKPWWDIDDTPLAPIFSLTVIGLIGWGVFSVGSCGYHAITRDRPDATVQVAQATEPVSVRDDGYSDTIVIAGAKSAVMRKLVDDRSARFREVGVVVQDSGTKAVCGEVNSKNRAGGYNGYQHFISAGTDEYTYLEEQVPNFSEAWNTLCVR